MLWSINKAREKTMEEENIFANAPHEGETPEEFFKEESESVDKELEVEKPAESQAEKEEESDLKLNSTWKEMREEVRAEKQARLDLEQRLQEIESKGKIDEPIEQPEFLTKMIGQNEEVAKDYRSYESELKEKIKQELIEDQVKAQEKEEETKQYWNKWTQERFKEVESEFKVNFTAEPTLRNELAKIMTDYTPTDEQGNLDYRKGMKLLTDLKKSELREEEQKVQVKKTISDASVSRETSSKQTKDFLTAKDMRGGWRSIVGKDY